MASEYHTPGETLGEKGLTIWKQTKRADDQPHPSSCQSLSLDI